MFHCACLCLSFLFNFGAILTFEVLLHNRGVAVMTETNAEQMLDSFQTVNKKKKKLWFP